MELTDLFNRRLSAEQIRQVINFIGNDKTRFAKLMSYCFSGNEKTSSNAANIAAKISSRYPEIAAAHIPEIIRNLNGTQSGPAFKRHALKILQQHEIPDKETGVLIHLCFEYITGFVEPPAVKAHALTVLYMLSARYPEIRNELKLVIEERFDNESAAFKSRAKKILKSILSQRLENA